MLVDEIADVERDIREMHNHRQRLHEKLKSLQREREQMQEDLRRQQRQLDGEENENRELAKKKDDLTNLQKLGKLGTQETSTPADRKPMLQKEKVELDAVIFKMEGRLTECRNSGMTQDDDLEYLEAMIKVLKDRQCNITAWVSGEGQTSAQKNIEDLKKLKMSQEQELEQLRAKVAAKEAERAAAGGQ